MKGDAVPPVGSNEMLSRSEMISAKAETISVRLLGGILPRQSIKHQRDVSVIHADILLELTHQGVNALERVWNVMVQMLLGGLIGHRSQKKFPVEPKGTTGNMMFLLNR